MRVLIVDDSPPVRLSLEHMLTQLGVAPGEIRSAGDAQQAMAVFHELQPNVVFLDIDLDPDAIPETAHPVSARPSTENEPPYTDHMLAFVDVDATPSASARDAPAAMKARNRTGTAVAQQMLAENPELRLVVCTGMDPTDARVRKMVSWGAFDVISKPLRAARVREVLRSIRPLLDRRPLVREGDFAVQARDGAWHRVSAEQFRGAEVGRELELCE